MTVADCAGVNYPRDFLILATLSRDFYTTYYTNDDVVISWLGGVVSLIDFSLILT